jgi:hypothetical protein
VAKGDGGLAYRPIAREKRSRFFQGNGSAGNALDASSKE